MKNIKKAFVLFVITLLIIFISSFRLHAEEESDFDLDTTQISNETEEVLIDDSLDNSEIIEIIIDEASNFFLINNNLASTTI